MSDDASAPKTDNDSPTLPPVPAAEHPVSLRWIRLGALGLVAAVALAYSNAFTVPFIFDDEGSILSNESIRSWRTMLFPPGSTGDTVGGRPLLNVSLAFNYAISKTNVWSYHVVNVLIHLVTGLALFGLVRRTLAGRGATGVRWGGRDAFFCALAASALWMLHPLQTESVTYIVQRAESLMSMLYVLTLYCFARSFQCSVFSVQSADAGSEANPCGSAQLKTENGKLKTNHWLAASVFFCALGMAAKEVMVSAPVLVFLYDRAFVAGSFKAAWRARWKFYLILCATWLVLALCLSISGFRGGTAGYDTPVTWWMYAYTQAKAIMIYLKLVFWPSPLVFDYGVFFIVSPSLVWWQIAVVVTLAVAALFAMFRFPRAGIFGALFFAVLAPSSSFLPVVSQSMAEHRMYLPSAAIIVALAVACHWLARRLSPAALRVAGVAACAIAILFGVMVWQRNQIFQSVVSIWQDTVEKRPDSHRAQNNIGCALIDDKQYEKGIPYCLRATQLKPDYGEAFGNVGYGLSGLERFAEAIPYYEKALFYMRKIGLTNLDRVLLNYGLALRNVGRDTDARAAFEEAVSVNPKNAPSLNNVGNYEFLAGRYAEAKKFYERAVAADPDFAEAWYDLGNAVVAMGQAAGGPALDTAMREAEQHYRHAIKLSPDLLLAQDNLGRLLLAMNRPKEAAEYLEKVIKDTKDKPNAAAQLSAAKAFMQTGKTADAIPLLEALLRQDPNNIEANYLLGNARYSMGDPAAAMTAYRQVIHVNPFAFDPRGNPGGLPDATAQRATPAAAAAAATQLSTATTLMQTGKTADAIPLLEALLRDNPDSIEACYLLGNARYRTGDIDAAMNCYRQAIRINPFAVEPHGNLGSLLAAKGRWDDAIAELGIALQLKPDYAEAHQNLANALVQQNHLAEARAHFQEALRLKPELPQTHLNYARLLLALGETEAARARLQEAIRLRPDYTEAIELLKTLPPPPAPAK